MVDDLLVVGIDQGNEEGNRDRNERKAPNWDELDEPVGDQTGRESLHKSGQQEFRAVALHQGQTYGNSGH